MTVIAELHSDDYIYLTTEWRHKEQVKTIPGTKWSTDHEQWRVPVSWTACLALRTTFGSELQVGPDLTDWAIKIWEDRIGPCTELREVNEYEGDPSLYWWQRSGAEFIARGKRVLITDDPGAGKTITTIKGLQRLLEEGENPFPALFVCPSSMKKTWKRELEKWWPGLEVVVVKGTTAQRRKQLATPAHVYVMNFEALRSHSRLIPYGSTTLKKCTACGGEDPKVTVTSCQVHEKELNKINFQAVVADEIHKCKDGKSQQTRALKAATGDAPIRIGLTGTPISNDVTDLWSLLHWLEPDEYSAKTRWIDRYIETMLNLFGGMLVIGIKPSMEQEFYASINPRMRRMPEDVILTHLPPVIYERRDCEMAPKQAKAYKQAKEDFIIDLESGSLPSGSAMVRMIRLLQFASSYAEVEAIEDVDEHGFPKIKYKTTLTEPSAKLDAFMDDIDTFGTEQVAVMSVSRQLLELLSTRLTKKGIKHGMITGTTSEDDRNDAMEAFQAGKIQFILFTSGAGGTGITLTAARYLCRLQVPFSLVDYKQSLRRVRRIGSERHENIIVIDYITEDTEDEHVFDVLDKKSMNFEDVVRDQDALLRMLKNEED